MTIEFGDAVITTDEEGYLVDPNEWNFEIAQLIAAQGGIQLSQDHRAILEFMRNYYEQHRIAVDARFVVKYIAEDLGYGDQAKQHLYQLFPYGYMQQACKIAGMQRPRAWSTG